MLPPIRGHEGCVFGIAFSFDGSKIFSGSSDETIRVWDANIEILPPLQGHDGSVHCIAFSPNGSKIVSGSADKTIRVWDVGTGIEMLPPLQGHEASIRFVAFSHDESKIISGSDDKTIRVWDVGTGIEMLPPLRGHEASIRFVAFSQDESKIISASNDQTIRVWNARTGVPTLPPLQVSAYVIYSVFSPAGSEIISKTYSREVQDWDAINDIKLQTVASDLARSALNNPVKVPVNDEWFSNINTGRCIGRSPVGQYLYSWKVHESTFVGWNLENKIVVIHFPT
jgi:WD40 repeat protein